MAGIQIDGVNNKIDFDDDADTSISSATDDTLVIESGGVNIASITAGEFAINDDQANIDFRVESDSEHSMLFVDASQHSIGVATGDPAIASGRGIVVDGGSSVARVELRNDTSGDTASDGMFLTYSGTDAFVGNREAGTVQFWNNGAERMRITSAGQVSIGASGPVGSSRLFFYASASTPYGLITQNNATTGSMYAAQFLQNDGSTELGSIKISNTATAFNTSSDYRLKENVVTDWNATTRLKQLKPSRFNFIADADTTVDGFLAHEVSSIVPEAISGDKDATETKTKVVVNSSGFIIRQDVEEADWIAGKVADEDGKTEYPTDSTWEASKVVPVYQGIDQSKLVPLMVKTIQELEARIKALEDA